MEFETIVNFAQSKDSKLRLRAIQAVHERVNAAGEVDPQVVPLLVEVLQPGLRDTHSQVVQGSLATALLLVESLEADFAPFLINMWPAVVERLGDAKAVLRERAVDLAVSAATIAIPPADAFELIRPAFAHRNWRARESALLCLSRTLAASESCGRWRRNGEHSSTTGALCKALLPVACKLLEDQQPLVREAAATVLEEMQRHWTNLPGELRKQNIRATVLKPLLNRLSAPRDRTCLEAERNAPIRFSSQHMNSALLDEQRLSSQDTELLRGEHGSCGGGSVQSGCVPLQCTVSPVCLRSASPKATHHRSSLREGPQGEMASHAPLSATISSERELLQEMEVIGEQLRNKFEWSVRQTALRRLQALVLGGAADFQVFADQLRGILDLLVTQSSELRSSLVKDTCKLVELLVAHMRDSFEPFVDVFLPALLKNTVVTIAVISCSSHHAILNVLSQVPTIKCLERLLAGLSSRSSTMRTRCAEYLSLLFERMPVCPESERNPLQRHVDTVCAALRAALSDSNSEARAYARACYWQLQRHAPARCQRLLGTLDRPMQRLIYEEQPPKCRVEPGIIAARGAAPLSAKMRAMGGYSRGQPRDGDPSTDGQRCTQSVKEGRHRRGDSIGSRDSDTIGADNYSHHECCDDRGLPLKAQTMLKAQMGLRCSCFMTQLARTRLVWRLASSSDSANVMPTITNRIEDADTVNVRAIGDIETSCSRDIKGFIGLGAATCPGSSSLNADGSHAALIANKATILLRQQSSPQTNCIAEEWSILMSALLFQLTGTATAAAQREALLDMHKMAMTVPSDASVWSTHFEHALEAVLRALQHEEEPLRDLSLSCTKNLMRAQPQRFRAFSEHVLIRLLDCGRDSSREVALAAEEALLLLLSISDPHRCMAVLVPVVMREEPPTLQLALRLMAKLMGHFSQSQLLSILPQLLPPLFESFKNPNADVRKAVVFCLVDMYVVLGEQLTPHLSSLTTSQLKLVTIYINKTTRSRTRRTC